jgi:hypothetical protein
MASPSRGPRVGVCAGSDAVVVRDGAERVEDRGLGTVADDGIGPARVRRGLIDGAGPDWSFRSAAC